MRPRGELEFGVWERMSLNPFDPGSPNQLRAARASPVQQITVMFDLALMQSGRSQLLDQERLQDGGGKYRKMFINTFIHERI